jgi:hypothetical protein
VPFPAVTSDTFPARSALSLRRCLIVVLCLTATALLAARNFPQDARFGELTRFSYPYATIGDKTLRMSPGAKIYNEQNLIIMPAAMRQQGAVLYRLDNAGALSAIWLLTAQEAASYASKSAPKPAPKPDSESGQTPR